MTGLDETKNLLDRHKSRNDDSENRRVKEITQVAEASNSELEDLVSETLGPLADDYSIRILSATQEEGKTVRELSKELDIPIATCYRRAGELLNAELLVNEEKKLTQEGKRASVLRSNASKVEVSFRFEDDELKVTIEPVKKR